MSFIPEWAVGFTIGGVADKEGVTIIFYGPGEGPKCIPIEQLPAMLSRADVVQQIKDKPLEERIVATGAITDVEYQDDHPGGSTPSQYGLPDGATELQDLIEHRGMNFARGNIFKACYRDGVCSHSDAIRDMRKIIWFAGRELARLIKLRR